LTNRAEGEAPNDAVPRRLSAADVDSREQIVNPLSLNISDKASDINVI